ncbi:hypothetical protein C5Z25_09950 [Lactobacillus sp. CBA3605]|uniref:thioredoxin domain-containing protein n=1 Tax=Lactobacillus sp. CBA3605 TaxID=2099788 RepID=UPI000CFDEC19|nr:thioredoxin domain-containing protein [Lactobacillus sp. CBA3605]AVK62077.1 hypothetical protein C5Z25_09950 [Lactobacillus sp. CBA3605]
MTKYKFNYDQATTLTYGNRQAPKQLTTILNLGCVDTQNWWLLNQAALFEAVDQGQLVLHLKFWSKVKPALMNGNVANGYVDYQHPTAALAFIQAVFQQQAALRALTTTAVPAYLQTTFQVQPYPEAMAVQQQIDREILDNGITSVPTLIMAGKAYFDEQLLPIEQLL